MSNMIAVLESIGWNASSQLALRDGDDAVLGAVEITPDERAALLAGDGARLAALIGAPKIVCCALEKHDDDEDEDVPAREDDEDDKSAIRAQTLVASPIA